MNLIQIPIMQDNYVWLLNHQKNTVIIDPGAAAPVINILEQQMLVPSAILLTHHHLDHVGGVQGLLTRYPEIKVYGPQETKSKGAQYVVTENKPINVGSMMFQVIEVPGHTLGHVAYYCSPYLFSGDTLFSGGCGRVFEGTAQQLLESLNKLVILPDNSKICCAHEYTLNNMQFAAHMFPNDKKISDYLMQVKEKRKLAQSTLPTTLATEKQVNIFLRCHDSSLKQWLKNSTNILSNQQFFTLLREGKDHF